MAKKVKRVEKETRRVMESIRDLVKLRSDGTYKFKIKDKKQIKAIRRTCPHWTIEKKGECAAVELDVDPTMWRCRICNERFPVNPKTPEDYEKLCREFLMAVNQMQFWSVKLGGDATDTKMFIALRKLVPRFMKVTQEIDKQINKQKNWEEAHRKSDAMSAFSEYSGYNYR